MLCLGADTFYCTAHGLLESSQMSVAKDIRKDFYKALDNRQNHINVKLGKCSFELFVLSNPGFLGKMNRARYSEKSNKDGLALMKEDWKQIVEYL